MSMHETLKMAEKNLENAGSDQYISVVVNFKNLRFMTLVKENCIISDLIKEVESTFVKLYSVKVRIKTLKNALNAVLPHWYPVAPLIRNQDEIFAFTDSAADVFNINFTKHWNFSTNTATVHNTTSPLDSGVIPDSGFTSPVMKVGTPGKSEEDMGESENTRLNEVPEAGQEGNDLNRPDENLSQDEGNDLLSEIFSLKDDLKTAPKQKDEIPLERSRIKSGNLNKNTVDENDSGSALKARQDKLRPINTLEKGQNSKTVVKESGLEDSRQANSTVEDNNNLEDDQEKKFNSNDVTLSQKDINKSNEKTGITGKEQDSDSSSNSSDESSWESDDSSKKTKDAKKASEQKKSSKISPDTTKRKKTSSKTEMKSGEKNLVQGSGDESDTSKSSIDDEGMEVDQTTDKTSKKAISKNVNTDTDKTTYLMSTETDLTQTSVQKKKPLNDENMEVNVKKPEERNKESRNNSSLVSEIAPKNVKAKSGSKSGRKESKSSDDSSEDGMVVDESKNMGVEKTTDNTAVDLNTLPDGKSNSFEVSDSKEKALGGNTLTFVKTKIKKTKNSGADTLSTEDSSQFKIAQESMSADKEEEQESDSERTKIDARKISRKKDEMAESSGKIDTSKEKVKNTSKIGKDNNKLDTKKKPEMAKNDLPDKMKDEDSGDSSSSSSDTESDQSLDEKSKKPNDGTGKQQRGCSKADPSSKNENVSENAKKGEDISVKVSGNEIENMQDNNLSKKSENNKAKISGASNKVDKSSDSDSSWQSSDDEAECLETANKKTSKTKTEQTTGQRKVESQTENRKDEQTGIDGDKTNFRSSKNGKGKIKTTQKPTNGSKSDMDNNTKQKSKRKDEVKSDDEDKQPKLNGPPSPTKSVGYKRNKQHLSKNAPASPAKSVGHLHKKSKEVSKNIPATPARSIARSTKSVSTKNKKKAESTKAKKAEVDVNSDDEGSDSTHCTLKAPFTQLPAKDKTKWTDDGVRKGGNDKIKRKQKSADDKTDHVSTTLADQAQPTDLNTSVQLPHTPKSSRRSKSAALLSASKVASWLLSNPVAEDVAEMTGSETATPKEPKTRSQKKTKENITNVDSVVDNDTLTSPSQSQKRKLDEVSEQALSTKSKKNKKKKPAEDGKKQGTQQLDGETQETQEQPSAKRSLANKMGKSTSLSLPDISKGLIALAEDESDYSKKNAKQTKRRKLAPPAVNRRLNTSGFLKPSHTLGQKPSTRTKTTKSRIKKISSSQPNKTVEMNAREKEFLESGVASLDTLLNDESIKW